MSDANEFPQYIIVKCLENIKSKVDSEFVRRLGELTNVKLIEKTTEQWNQIIELIERCEEKYFDNRLTNAILNETKNDLDQIKLNDRIDVEAIENAILIVNNKLEAFFYSNDLDLQ